MRPFWAGLVYLGGETDDDGFYEYNLEKVAMDYPGGSEACKGERLRWERADIVGML